MFQPTIKALFTNITVNRRRSVKKMDPNVIIEVSDDDTIIYEPDVILNVVSPKRKSKEDIKESPKKLKESEESSEEFLDLNSFVNSDSTFSPLPEFNESFSSINSDKPKEINLRWLDLYKNIIRTAKDSKYLKAEKEMYEKFLSLDKEYQYLLLKLFKRKDKWYYYNKFCSNIHLDMDKEYQKTMLDYLRTNKFVDTDDTQDIFELLNELDLKSLQKIKKSLRIKQGKEKNKESLVKDIIKFTKTQRTLFVGRSTETDLRQRILKESGCYIKLNESVKEAFYYAYILTTFMNNFENMSDFERTVLTHKRFPTMDIQDCDVFKDRDAFLYYVKAYELRMDLFEAVESKDNGKIKEIADKAFEELKLVLSNNHNEISEAMEKFPHLRGYCCDYVYMSILTECSKRFLTKDTESVKGWLEFLIKRFPNHHKVVNWYLNLIWLRIKYLNPPNLTMASELFLTVTRQYKGTMNERELFEIGHKGRALLNCKKGNLQDCYREEIPLWLPREIEDFPENHIEAKSNHGKGRKRHTYVGDDSVPTTVEQVAIEYYLNTKQFNRAEHCEGSIITSLFFLLFYDIIYEHPKEDTQGIFISEFQSFPLDFFTNHFYSNRKQKIDERIRNIEKTWTDSEIKDVLVENYTTQGNKIIPVNLQYYIKCTDMLITIFECIGRIKLAKIFSRLVINYRAYKSGLPDLFLWHTEKKTCKFVEVKGKGDTLQINQKLWLDYLRKINVHIEVCHVKPLKEEPEAE